MSARARGRSTATNARGVDSAGLRRTARAELVAQAPASRVIATRGGFAARRTGDGQTRTISGLRSTTWTGTATLPRWGRGFESRRPCATEAPRRTDHAPAALLVEPGEPRTEVVGAGAPWCARRRWMSAATGPAEASAQQRSPYDAVIASIAHCSSDAQARSPAIHGRGERLEVKAQGSDGLAAPTTVPGRPRRMPCSARRASPGRCRHRADHRSSQAPQAREASQR